MKENQGWREDYNKIIFEQVDINEETIPNFIQEQINKAVLEERGEIINLIDTCNKTDYSDTECEDIYDEGYEMCLQDIKDAIINSNN